MVKKVITIVLLGVLLVGCTQEESSEECEDKCTIAITDE